MERNFFWIYSKIEELCRSPTEQITFESTSRDNLNSDNIHFKNLNILQIFQLIDKLRVVV